MSFNSFADSCLSFHHPKTVIHVLCSGLLTRHHHPGVTSLITFFEMAPNSLNLTTLLASRSDSQNLFHSFHHLDEHYYLQFNKTILNSSFSHYCHAYPPSSSLSIYECPKAPKLKTPGSPSILFSTYMEPIA